MPKREVYVVLNGDEDNKALAEKQGMQFEQQRENIKNKRKGEKA
jgi:hypothetical protein